MIKFDKIVNKLLKLNKNIVNIIDIGKIVDPDFSSLNKIYATKIYKIIYRLKQSGIIFGLKNGLYFVNNNSKVNELEIIENNYWKILKKIIISETGGEYFLGGVKSLELYLKDFSLHNNVIVYTKNIQKTITINSNYKIHFKIFTAGKKYLKKSNIFNYMYGKYTKKIYIEDMKFNVSSEELSLMDSLLIKEQKAGINSYVVNKFILKYNDFLDIFKLNDLITIKYITSINRLRVISKNLKILGLNKKCIELINISGGSCFLSFK